MTSWIRKYIFDRELPFHILMGMAWGFSLFGFVRGVITKIPVIKDYPYETEAVIIAVFFLLSLPALLRRLHLWDALFLLLVPLWYLANYVLFEDNCESLDKYAMNSLLLAFPFYIFGSVVNVQKYFNYFCILSVCSIVGLAFYFLSYADDTSQAAVDMATGYSMGRAYEILPHLIFVMWSCIKEFRIWKLFFVILGFFMMMAFGTRGPLVCVVFFAVVYFFIVAKFRNALVIKSVVLTVSGIVGLFIQDIARWMYDLFNDANMSVRILEKLMTGQLGNDSGRGFIQYKMWNILDNKGAIFGNGYYGSEHYGVRYPHHLILDVLFTFGYIIGAILLVALVYLVITAYLRAKSQVEKEFVVVLTSIGIVKLFLSNSFLEEPMFYMLIGFCTKILIGYYRQSKSEMAI